MQETNKKKEINENRFQEMQEKINTIQSKNELLVSQLNEAEVNNKTLYNEIDEMKKENSDQDRASDKLLLEVHDLKKKIEHQKKEIASLQQKQDFTEKTNKELHRKLEKEKEENLVLQKKLEESISELQILLKSGNTPEKREEMLKKELLELVNENDKMNLKYKELKCEKDKLEKLISFLAQQNHMMEKRLNDESSTPTSIPLVNHQEKSNNLEQLISDSKPTSHNGKGFSLFDQLKESNDPESPIPSISTSKPSTTIAPTLSQSNSKQNVKSGPSGEQEYFTIASTAIKIKLAIKYPHKSDEVFKIKPITLYEEALSKGIPFHEWYTWIDETLQSKLVHIVTPSIENKNDVLIITPNKKTENVKKKWFW